MPSSMVDLRSGCAAKRRQGREIDVLEPALDRLEARGRVSDRTWMIVLPANSRVEITSWLG